MRGRDTTLRCVADLARWINARHNGGHTCVFGAMDEEKVAAYRLAVEEFKAAAKELTRVQRQLG
jgi:hypothetical protein